MVYLQTLIRFVSLLRVVILSLATFFLIRGILGLSTPQLPLILDVVLLFSFLHTFIDTLRLYIYREFAFTYTAVLSLVWMIFLNTTGIHAFLVNNNYQTQTLFSAVTLIVIGVYLYQDLKRSFSIFSSIKIDSRLVIFSSFLLVIIIGAGLLSLPISSGNPGETISLVDAFFTAASAVCVTGLTVVDTAKDYSRFGQTIILILIQIGSLGLVTITIVFMNLLGRSLSMQGQLSAKNSFSSRLGDNSLQTFLRFALSFTLITELLLAIVFMIRFIPSFTLQVPTVYSSHLEAWAHASYYAVFHAISAFCNAGFSLYSDSLMQFRTDWLINFTVMFAIFAGGLGFLVWQDIINYSQKRTVRLRLQSLIALKVSFFLIISGTIIYFLLERNFSLKDLSTGDQLLSSLFVSINLRTAGFNTTDLNLTSEAARFFSVILMYIGSSPGSTGGGIKTTTFAIILATVRQITKGQQEIILNGRRINTDVAMQAWFLMINSLIWIAFVVIILAVVEKLPLSTIIYESVSAYATVGVSTGITPDLSSFSKILLSLTMIIGRVGPSTVILAFAGHIGRQKLTLAPEEDLPVG